MRSLAFFFVAAFAGLVPDGAALAFAWGIDHAKSGIAFAGAHMGNPFTGRFESWDGNIEFDPAAPGSAVVLMTIDTASAKTGNATYDGTLPQADWFDVDAYPQARFEAFGATAQGEGRFTLDGKLTIRSNSVPVGLPFEASDKEARAEATITLNRLDFGIGAESDPDGQWVSKEITVTITLVAHPSAQ